MRVLYASRGRGIHDRRFVAALSAPPPDGPGWTVEAVALAESPPDAVTAREPAFDEAVDRLARIAISFGPDVTVAGPLLDVGLAAVRAGIRPLLGISWGFDLLLDAREAGMAVVAREVLAGCDVVACDARAVADAAIGFGMAPAAIERFPWGVDLARFRPGESRKLREQLGWDHTFVVLCARAHEPMYGLPVLVEGFVLAAARRPELRLLILGDGSQRADLEARVTAAGLVSRVHFAGRVDQTVLPAYFAAADCYASASRVDGSSVSLLEALAAGLPAVATAVGGNPEWITPGVTGWLVPVDDADALGAALVEVAALPAHRLEAMAAAARRVAEDRADWRRNVRVFVGAVARAAAVGRVAG